RSGFVGHPAIAPAEQRHDDGIEVAPFLRELVLIARRPFLIPNALEDPVLDELLQATGEHVACRPETSLKLLEAACAQEGLAQDEQRPAIADHRQRPRDRAGLVADVAPAHVPTLYQKSVAF